MPFLAPVPRLTRVVLGVLADLGYAGVNESVT